MAVTIDQDLCESTGCCAAVCPEDVLEHENTQTTMLVWFAVQDTHTGGVMLDRQAA